jgi:hypothetical protein
MDELVNLLKDIQQRLTVIEKSLSLPDLERMLIKSHYSCRETADLTQKFGTKKAKEFTVRLACSDRRIPDAVKHDDGQWRIPRDAVLRILSDGLPPERRHRH